MNVSTKNEQFKEIVEKTSRILEGERSWRTTFKGYVEDLTENLDEYRGKGKLISKKLPRNRSKEIQLYSSVTRVKNAKGSTAYYDLRFRGQPICELRVKDKEINLYFKSEHLKNNKEDFNIEPQFEEGKPYLICSKEAKDFFKEFGQIPPCKEKTKGNERKLESLVLRSFAKKSGKKLEGLRNIQPVKLGVGFFQLRTPLKASKHNPEYSIDEIGRATGGGIDILARFSGPWGHWRLAVIELKDENDEKEPVGKVMTQALIYSTFMAYLLADEKCGENWFNFFRDQKGDPKDQPKTFEILVMTMMPEGKRDKINEEPIVLTFNKNRKIKLIPCTCYLDNDGICINRLDGSYLKYKYKK